MLRISLNHRRVYKGPPAGLELEESQLKFLLYNSLFLKILLLQTWKEVDQL